MKVIREREGKKHTEQLAIVKFLVYHEHNWIATKCKTSPKYIIYHMHVQKITVFINKMEDCACFTDSDGKSGTENDLDN